MKELIDRELVAKVKANFGLNDYESKVWLALLSKGISTVGEISDLSGVPRSRVYDVLESLEKKGFVIMKIGKPIRYMALKPEEVVERIKSNLLNDAKEKIKVLEKVKETDEYKQLEFLFSEGIQLINPEDTSNLIKGKFNIHYNLKAAIKNAKRSVIVVTTTNNLANKARILKPLMDKLQKSRVKVIIAAKGDERIGKRIARELGIKIRKIDFDARFCIIDGKEAFIMINEGNDNKNDVAIHIKSPFFATALTNFLSSYFSIKN